MRCIYCVKLKVADSFAREYLRHVYMQVQDISPQEDCIYNNFYTILLANRTAVFAGDNGSEILHG